MEVRQMRYFLAVAETQHFRRAAEMLHLSQPSLSQQIQQIEAELGVVLFERTNRKVQLTPAGSALVPRLQAVLHNINEAIEETRRVDRGLSGNITIGFVSTALVGVLPGAMKALQAAVPGIELTLSECEPKEQIAHLLSGTIDIGFMHATLEEKQLTSAVIQRDRMMAAMPEGLAPAGKVNLCDYTGYTSIMPSPFTSFGFYNHVRRAYQLAGATPQKSIYTNLIIGGINLVAAGIGIALVPSSFQAVRIAGVEYRELLTPPPPVELLAVWKVDSNSRILRRFLSILKKTSRDPKAKRV
jgi:DNA-binding transcriptional LysR family regulator